AGGRGRGRTAAGGWRRGGGAGRTTCDEARPGRPRGALPRGEVRPLLEGRRRAHGGGRRRHWRRRGAQPTGRSGGRSAACRGGPRRAVLDLPRRLSVRGRSPVRGRPATRADRAPPVPRLG